MFPLLFFRINFCMSDGELPNYDFLKVFGYLCFFLFQTHECTKLEFRAQLYYFLGCSIEYKDYKCYDLLLIDFRFLVISFF